MSMSIEPMSRPHQLQGQKGGTAAASGRQTHRTSQHPHERQEQQSDHQTSLSPAEQLEDCNFESQSQKDREKGWRLLAAQTNTQLLHVLCDLVQAFIDTEKQIEVSLTKLGFGDGSISNSQTESEVLSSLSVDDMVVDRHCSPRSASAAHNNNNGQHANAEAGDFCDDGPDLINPSSFILNPESVPRELLNSNSGVKIDDDIVLGYSKRLRMAVDRILHLLKNVASLQYEPTSIMDSAKDESSSAARVISKSASMPTCTASACDHKQEIASLESQLREARRRIHVVQEELTKKHNALSSLKAQIETQSILDAKFLKEQNDELTSKLAASERKIQRQADMIRQLRSDSTHARDDCAVIELTPERGRRERPFSPPDLNDADSLPFDKSEELLNLDELDSMSSDRWDRIFDENMDNRTKNKPSIRNADAGDGVHKSHSTREPPVQQDRDSLLLRIIEEKDEEIQVLKNQMRLAQSMIASSFPEQKMDEYLDEDFIETLVDSHLKHRMRKKDSRSSVERKNRFSGVDLIEPIQDMRSANGQESPKSSTSSGGIPNGLLSNESSFLEVQVMDAKISQLQTVIEKLISKNTETQLELNEYRSQKVQLQRDLDLTRKQKDSREHEIEEQQRELIGLRISLDEKDDEIQNMRRRQEDLTQQQVQLIEQKVRLQQEELSAREEQIHNLKRRIEDMKSEAETRKQMEKREDEEVAAQISQLKGYNKDLELRVRSYELKIKSLLSKIESLTMEIQSRVLDEQRLRGMEKQLRALDKKLRSSENMIEVKKNKIKELMDAMRKVTVRLPDFTTPRPILKQKSQESEACDIFQMAAKLKKCQQQKRELVYQKNYLLKLVDGFQLTEAATLAFIAHMKEGVAPELEDEAVRLRPISKFRAAVTALIAISRMKFLIRKRSSPHVTHQKRVTLSEERESNTRKLKHREQTSPANETYSETQRNNYFTSGSHRLPAVQRTHSPGVNASTSATFAKSKKHTPPKWVRVQGHDAGVEKSRATTDRTVDDFFERIRRVHEDMNFSHSLSEVDSIF